MKHTLTVACISKSAWQAVFEHWATMAPYYYLSGQRAWDPRAGGHAILDDYFQRCYGPAAAPVKPSVLKEITQGGLDLQ